MFQVKNSLTLFRIILLQFILFGFGTSEILAQKIDEKFCVEVVNEVILPIKPMKFYREDVFKTDCQYEFSLDKSVSVSVSIEKLPSKKDAKKEMKDSIGMLTAHDSIAYGKKCCPRKKFDDFWDEGFLYSPREWKESFSSGMVIVRKDTYLVIVIAPKVNVLSDIEKSLRKINWSKSN